jgi:hypothetical protein
MKLLLFPLALAMVAPGLSPSRSPAQEARPSLAGSWERDPQQSDDASEKMRAALDQMREQMEKRRGGPPGGGYGGPPPDGPGGEPESRGGGRRPRRAGITAVPDELRVELAPGELRVDDGERVQIYYLDGNKHLRELPNGTKLETIATLEGDVVRIAEKLDRGKVDREIGLGPGGKTMISTLTVKMKGMKQPVVIRTVYARVDPGDL